MKQVGQKNRSLTVGPQEPVPEKVLEDYKVYLNFLLVCRQVREIRHQLGRPPREFMDLEEIRENLNLLHTTTIPVNW